MARPAASCATRPCCSPSCAGAGRTLTRRRAPRCNTSSTGCPAADWNAARGRRWTARAPAMPPCCWTAFAPRACATSRGAMERRLGRRRNRTAGRGRTGAGPGRPWRGHPALPAAGGRAMTRARSATRQRGVGLLVVLVLLVVVSVLAVAMLDDIRFGLRRAAGCAPGGAGPMACARRRGSRPPAAGRHGRARPWRHPRKHRPRGPGPPDRGGRHHARPCALLARRRRHLLQPQQRGRGRGRTVAAQRGGRAPAAGVAARSRRRRRRGARIRRHAGRLDRRRPGSRCARRRGRRLPRPRPGAADQCDAARGTQRIARAARRRTGLVHGLARVRVRTAGVRPLADRRERNDGARPAPAADAWRRRDRRVARAADPGGAPATGWTSAEAFWAQPALAGFIPSAAVRQQVQVRGRYDRLEVAVAYDDALVELSSLLEADPSGRVRLLSRRWTREE